MEDIKQIPRKLLEMKTTLLEMKEILHEVAGKWEIVEEMVGELEDKVIETIQNETQGEKNMDKKKKMASVICGSLSGLIHMQLTPQKEMRENKDKNNVWRNNG